nr:PREDICTED: C3a anaphylatoxin chemotactic receptor-like [Latimeria chalumnae]|eukprot:XP_006004733.2 PREDICTED: C3a anaphylatoxin chemotactic receptor-like [Latimeria chalumnae]
MVLYSIIFLLGVPGNAAVIWWGGLKIKKTVNSVWFVNLAIANFFCCLTLPFRIVDIALFFNWPFGHFLCKLNPLLIYTNTFASVFILIALSIDHCLLVIKPTWYLNKRTICMAYVLCLIIWALAFLMSLPFCVLIGTSTFLGHTLCYYNAAHANAYIHSPITSIPWAVLGILIPILVFMACYSIRYVYGKRKLSQTFKVILSAAVAYFVCWLPYNAIHILLTVIHFGTHLIKILTNLYHFTNVLVFSNSCINPILYVCFGHDFRGTSRWSMRHILENAFGEESMASTSNAWQSLSIEEDVASNSSVNASG